VRQRWSPTLAGSLRGADDVGEAHRGQHPVGRDRWAHTGEELLDLIDQGIGVTGEEQVVVTVEFPVGGIGDVLGQVAAVLHPHLPISSPVQHQRRSLDGGQHVMHVGHSLRAPPSRDNLRCRPRCRPRSGDPLSSQMGSAPPLVVDHARGHDLERGHRSPV
jgi:hypothetical protein